MSADVAWAVRAARERLSVSVTGGKRYPTKSSYSRVHGTWPEQKPSVRLGAPCDTIGYRSTPPHASPPWLRIVYLLQSPPTEDRSRQVTDRSSSAPKRFRTDSLGGFCSRGRSDLRRSGEMDGGLLVKHHGDFGCLSGGMLQRRPSRIGWNWQKKVEYRSNIIPFT